MKKIIILLIVLTSLFSVAQTEKKTKHRSVEEVVRSLYGKLEKTALENNVVKPKLNLGMELLRTDKKGQQIWLKKSEYPLGFKTTKLFNPNNFKLSIYEGKIIIPLQIYNPSQKDLALKSKKIQDTQITYVLEIIPIDKKGSTYTLNVSVINIFEDFSYYTPEGKRINSNSSGFEYSKKIELTIGEKVKLDTDNFHSFKWYVEDIIDGQKIVFNSNKDYYDFFNDYLILSLESDK